MEDMLKSYKCVNQELCNCDCIITVNGKLVPCNCIALKDITPKWVII